MDLNLVLSSISTWILPIIALLAALPYDSLHRRNDGAPWYQGRVSRTLGSLVNWLGSPQTALTATLWNIHQIRKCFHATAASGIGIGGDLALKPLKTDAYYGLSSISQFKIDYNLDKQHFLDVLAYGLFRPMLKPTAETTVATEMTTTLLQGMAFNLRMLRRRGVYPSFVSIFVFFIAYGVSLVLAFADFGEQTMPSTLSLGILVSWLPLLVLFTILDRNPISADRTRSVISRYYIAWIIYYQLLTLTIQEAHRAVDVER
jgi:hypothetical protein